LQAIEPRLISRFEWGITLHLEKLGGLEMHKLLQKKLDNADFPLSEEAVRFLIKHFGNNPRSLLRAVEALMLRTHMRNFRSSWLVDASIAKDLLKDLIEEETKEALNPQTIIHAVAEFYGIPSGELLGKSQAQNCVLPRQIAMHLCRHELKIPYLRLGELFHRDHSTVMSSVKQIQKKLDGQDRELASALSIIRQKFSSK
jgi:chromosomal replication initiator protein